MICCRRWAPTVAPVLAAFFALGVASAEEPARPYTFVAEWTIARDQWAGYAEWTAKHHKPVLERLAADGTLRDWGIYETYVHGESGNTHGIWWSAATFAAVEKARLELLKAPFHPAAASGAHHDFLLRQIAGTSRSASIAGGFLSVNIQELKPGHEDEWQAAWEQVVRPTLDELVAKGTLASYALHSEDVHTAPMTTRFIVTVSPSAEAKDAVEAAFAAARARRSEAERQDLAKLMRETTAVESHRDYLAKVSAAWVK